MRPRSQMTQETRVKGQLYYPTLPFYNGWAGFGIE
jgi:hypothetical protein